MKPIIEFEIVDHGVQHSQYFQGCGVSFTKYDMCFTGIGRSAAGALEDALEQIASSGEFDVETNADLLNQCRQAPDDDDVLQLYADCNEAEPEESELYYTVSIRLK